MTTRRRLVRMAGPIVDPHTAPMSRTEQLFAVLIAIELTAGVLIACLIWGAPRP